MVLPQINKAPTIVEKSTELSENIESFNSHTDKEKTDYVNNLIDSNFNKNHKDDTSVGYLTSEVLLKAPTDFFDKFDVPVDQTVLYIQNELSALNESEILGKARSNPDDARLKKTAISKIDSLFVKYTDGEPKGKEMIRNFRGNDSSILKALVANELIGLGVLEPLWEDERITEIICNGPHDIQVEINGNVHKVPSCHFVNGEKLLKLINRLYAPINKSISRNTPIMKGRLYDNSRMMAIGTTVAPEGPNFNIRRHSGEYWGPSQILETDMANKELLSYIGNLIYNNISYLVIGGTGTGKTTLLDALTAYYRPDERIVTLEDNLEMKPHPRKLFSAPMECVEGKAGSIGSSITMRDLVHASLQMRPEAVIIGEVTDEAAYDLCQALNTGHAGASTVHANNAKDAIYRLMSLVSQSDLVKDRAAYDLIASAFDVIITVQRFPVDGSRKIVDVSEVGDRPERDDEGNMILPTTQLWSYNINSKDYAEGKTSGVWEQKAELSDKTKIKHNLNLRPALTWPELEKIAKV